MSGLARALVIAAVVAPTAARAQTPAPDEPGVAAGIPWRWEGEGTDPEAWRQQAPEPARAAGPSGSRFVLVIRAHVPHLRRLDSRGATVWDTALERFRTSASLAADGETLYAALYEGAASG